MLTTELAGPKATGPLSAREILPAVPFVSRSRYQVNRRSGTFDTPVVNAPGPLSAARRTGNVSCTGELLYFGPVSSFSAVTNSVTVDKRKSTTHQSVGNSDEHVCPAGSDCAWRPEAERRHLHAQAAGAEPGVRAAGSPVHHGAVHGSRGAGLAPGSRRHLSEARAGSGRCPGLHRPQAPGR